MQGINRVLRHVVICLSCNIRKYVINVTGVRQIKRNTLLVAPRVWGSIHLALVQGFDKIPSFGVYPFTSGMEYTVY